MSDEWENAFVNTRKVYGDKLADKLSSLVDDGYVLEVIDILNLLNIAIN